LNTIYLLLAIGFGAFVDAESKVPEHFFDAPVGPFACREIKTSPADSAASILEFIDGEANARETLVAYDSAGLPLYMTVQMTESSPSIDVSHNVVVRFKALGEYLRIEKPFKDGKFVEEAARFTDDPLTANEMMKSEQFAVWLWNHRCNR
jgi:hypothetical protein